MHLCLSNSEKYKTSIWRLPLWVLASDDVGKIIFDAESGCQVSHNKRITYIIIISRETE
jgi:hypothetical protein